MKLPDRLADDARTSACSDALSPEHARALRLARIGLAFGRVDRATRHEDGRRPETDTDHTTMLGLVACELAPDHLTRAEVAAFSLVHDLVEVESGDTPTLVISPEGMAAKEARESAARARLTAELGEGSWLADLLAAYERQQQPEARFVRLIDKVLPQLTHALNGCVAARAFTDRAGFVDANARQLRRLREEYPEFPGALELLRSAMRHAEESWPLPEGDAAPRQRFACGRGHPCDIADAPTSHYCTKGDCGAWSGIFRGEEAERRKVRPVFDDPAVPSGG